MTFFKFLLFALIFIAFLSLAPVSQAQAATITFNDLQPVDAPLNNQYPAGVVNWGNNQWFLSGPWGSFTSNSISFQSSSMTSATFSFVSPSVLNSLDAYNGGTGSSTVTLSCTGNSTVTQVVSAGQMTTINTNWVTACSTITLTSSNNWWTNFDNFIYGVTSTPTPSPTTTPIPTATPTPTVTPTPTPSPTTGPLLVYHNIVTDQNGYILPWYSSNLGDSYDHIINLTWNYWRTLPNEANGIPAYLQHRMIGNSGAIGGDQLAMALSSWNLLYQYSGDPSVVDNMKYIADFYISNGLSSSTSSWPNLPYPANADGVNTVTLTFFDRDLVRGVGYTQPDKAGSFGAELVTLYKITNNSTYLTTAVNIANTLSSKVVPGDSNTSPLPFRVNVNTGQVSDPYTTNWTGTLELFDSLIALNQGNTTQYAQAKASISTWLKTYPLVNAKWGPFFEDIDFYSDTEVNADTLAHYILEHPEWDSNGNTLARNILNSTQAQFGNSNWDNVNWAQYGVLPINEQTAYMVPGNSHTSRHGSVELEYAAKTGDMTRKDAAIRQLSWATYMVDATGANLYPTNAIWLTDGYGDYIRHYLRAMASAPEIAPNGQSHLLKSSSVIQSITYAPTQITYTTFDTNSRETLKLNFTPLVVSVDGDVLTNQTDPNVEGWSFDQGIGVLQVHHTHGTHMTINTGAPPTPTPTPTATPVPTPATGVHLAVMSDSSSDEYRADDNRAGSTSYAPTTLAWTELLAQKRNFDLGVWGTRSEPRRSGYEFNWARTGAEAQDVISAGQHTGIASQISSGLINVVYFQIGNNDFAYYRQGADIYNGTISGTALTDKINAYIANVTTALDTVLSTNPTIKVILGNMADPGQIPYWQSQFPDSTKRQKVTDAINTVNQQIDTIVASRPRVTLFNQQAFAQSVLSRVDATGNLVIGGENISMTVNGDEPHHATIGDNIHGGTVLEGVFANEIIKKINTMIGSSITEFTDAELLANAGIIPATPTPTPTATPIPTVTPTPTPTVTPTPTPTPTVTPTPTPVGTTITFNDLTNPDRNLNGQYPTSTINWGTNQWYLSAPWGSFTTNSVSFATNVASKTFSFVTPKKLVSVQAYNGGTGSSTITLACSGNTTKTQAIAAGQTATIVTGWTNTCTTVTVGSTNNWWTNFDNFIIQ